MKIPLQKINVHEPLPFGGTVDVSELEQLNNDIRKISDVVVDGTAELNGKIYRLNFQLKGTMILPCARTLVDVEYPFVIEAEEQFTTEDYRADEENEIFLIDREMLDLMPYIKENILLEVPLRVYAPEEDLNEATDTGQGWEMKSEDEHEKEMQNEDEQKDEDQPIDPRLSALKGFFEEKNQEDDKKK